MGHRGREDELEATKKLWGLYKEGKIDKTELLIFLASSRSLRSILDDLDA